MPALGELEIERQKQSNQSSLPHFASFEPHRRRLSALILPPRLSGGGRLCVLGAGNAYDLELDAVVACYDEVHLVDLDSAALERAAQRVRAEHRQRLFLHAPVDLSGLLGRLSAWKDLRVTEEELVQLPERASANLEAALGGPFDVVLSACVLSQMLFGLRSALSSRHPLFEAGCFTVVLTHLRTLLRLTAAGGRAILATDVASDEITPLDSADPEDALPLLHQLAWAGDLFSAVSPANLKAVAEDDPVLRQQARLTPPESAWIWANGPKRRFLVCAMELRTTAEENARSK